MNAASSESTISAITHGKKHILLQCTTNLPLPLDSLMFSIVLETDKIH